MIARLRHLSSALLTRILLVEAVTIVVACVLLPLLARSVLHNSVATIEKDMLRQQAYAIAASLQPTPDGGLRVALPAAHQPIYASGYDGRAYAVLGDHGQVLDASRLALPSLWPADLRGNSIHRFEGGPLVGLSLPLRDGPRRIWVVVTQDQSRPGAVVDDVVRKFLGTYWVVLVGLLALMPLVNGIILWGSLRGLRRAARNAAAIHPRTPGARIDESGLPAEAQVLVHATNDLIERLSAALHQVEEFAGNVAHELRTPLATLQLQVATLGDAPQRAALEAEIARMSHVLAQLRDLASMENAARAALAPLDLGELAIATVADLTPRVLAEGRSIAVLGAEAPVMVTGNAGLLTMALTNLIENALLHTPGGTVIEVTLAPTGAVSVADDGPGIAQADHGKLARRFWRADHRRSDGAGLGLSIVQRIVEVHRGQLETSDSPLGGACFTIKIPCV
ncbi:sensor histidine kinase [Novosphingobium terrae]|uniref:sensor histidine kinase n=1 Tax=Novosphingobium terrae TaxID=2726189 RepID=UPI001981AB9D|nr:HAMP domain-containing sensor histidine kinase [Novosphingobium terrae]